MVAIDGCKLPSNASKEWSGTQADFRRKRKKLESAIDRILDKHRQQDCSSETQPAKESDLEYIQSLQKDIEKTSTFLEHNDDRIGLRGKDVKKMTSTALDLDAVGFDLKTGWGLVRAYDALNAEETCDIDGDGFCTEDGDCDNSDSLVNPGADGICGDSVDNDCNANTSDECSTCLQRRSPCSSNDQCCSGVCNFAINRSK